MTDYDMAPTAPEAEAALIGSLLVDPSQVPAIAALVSPGDFNGPGLGEVYRAILELDARGEGIDVLTVKARMKTSEIDGAYLVGLITRTPTSTYARSYASIVRETAIRRKVLAGASVAARAAYESGSGREALSVARAAFDELDVASGEVADGSVDAAFEFLLRQTSTGWRCGIPALDDWTRGRFLRPSNLLVLSGLTGVGKTWGVVLMLTEAAKAGARVSDFSLEMPVWQRVIRYAAVELGPAVFRLLDPPAGDPENGLRPWDDGLWDLHNRAWEYVRGLGVKIYPPELRDSGAIGARCRLDDAEVVGIDYYSKLARPEGSRDRIDSDTVLADRLEALAHHGSGRCVLVVAQRNEADTNLYYGQQLARACDGLIDFRDVTEEYGLARPVIRIRTQKNRWGPTDAYQDYEMDKSRGHLVPARA